MTLTNIIMSEFIHGWVLSVFGQPLSLTARSTFFLSLVVVRFMKSTLVCEITKLNLFPPLNLWHPQNMDIQMRIWVWFHLIFFLLYYHNGFSNEKVKCRLYTSLVVATVRIYACCLYMFCTSVSSYILGDKSVFLTCLTGFIKCLLYLF